MREIDLNEVADQGVQDLQRAIEQLNELLALPGVDISAIETKIEALEDKQSDLRALTLDTIERSDENRLALAAVEAAGAALTREAGQIREAATAIADAEKVIAAVGSLIGALAPLV
ncbi:MAG: hypothetical protein F8N37_20075 [Telmatospirillum sp.]|nr:hypothetical protein [Telmatospirillum sp.]